MKNIVYKFRYLLKPRQLFNKIRIVFNILFLKLFINLPDGIRIKSTKSTINEIANVIQEGKRGAYLRFGDGDINLLNGFDELLQKSKSGISQEMKESFSLSGDGIFKCLPIHSDKYGVEDKMAFGLHKSTDKAADNFLLRTFKYFIGENIYSHVALSYLIVFDREYALDFLRFLKKHNIIFVGNENIPMDVLNTLFRNPVIVKTPSKGAFSNIDYIEQRLSDELDLVSNEFCVVVVAMGCSGRILEKRILNKGYNVFLFDFGSSLDSFCGWNTRGWMDIVDVPKNYFSDFLKDI